MQGSGGFKLQPDPPIGGEALEIQCPPGTKEVAYSVDGGLPKSVPVDAKGKAVISPVPSGTEIGIWDVKNLDHQIIRPIKELES